MQRRQKPALLPRSEYFICEVLARFFSVHSCESDVRNLFAVLSMMLDLSKLHASLFVSKNFEHCFLG